MNTDMNTIVEIDLNSPDAPLWQQRAEALRALLSGDPDQDSIMLSGTYWLTSPLVVRGLDGRRIEGGEGAVIIVDLKPGQIGIHVDCPYVLLRCNIVFNVLPGAGKCDGVRLSGDYCVADRCSVRRVGDPGPRLYALHACRSRFPRIERCAVDLGTGPGYGPQLTDGVGGVIVGCDTTRILPPGHGIGYDTHPAGIVGGEGHLVHDCRYIRRDDKSGAAFRANGYLDDRGEMQWARYCTLVGLTGAPLHLQNVDGLIERGCDVAQAINVVGRVDSPGVAKLREQSGCDT